MPCSFLSYSLSSRFGIHPPVSGIIQELNWQQHRSIEESMGRKNRKKGRMNSRCPPPPSNRSRARRPAPFFVCPFPSYFQILGYSRSELISSDIPMKHPLPKPQPTDRPLWTQTYFRVGSTQRSKPHYGTDADASLSSKHFYMN